MLGTITQWFADLFVAVFRAAWDLITDLAIAIVDLFLTGVAGLLGAIPVPEFMSAGLGTLFAGLDGAIVYLLVHAGLPSAIALLAAGYGFRFTRKLVTLFQW